MTQYDLRMTQDAHKITQYDTRMTQNDLRIYQTFGLDYILSITLNWENVTSIVFPFVTLKHARQTDFFYFIINTYLMCQYESMSFGYCAVPQLGWLVRLPVSAARTVPPAPTYCILYDNILCKYFNLCTYAYSFIFFYFPFANLNI